MMKLALVAMFICKLVPTSFTELGWFCGRLDRGAVMLLLKEGTRIFSDFGGIVEKRFRINVSEVVPDIAKDLMAAGILAEA